MKNITIHAIAFKVLCLAPDLTNSDKKVAAAMLEHRNRRNGRCDPSIETLSSECGLCERSVKRSVVALAAASLFTVLRHRSYSGRNSYILNLDELNRRDSAWRNLLSTLAERRRVSRMAPGQGQSLPQDGDAGGTQTHISNLSEITQRSRALPTAEKQLAILSPTDAGDRHSSPGLNRPRSVPSKDAARNAATKRWDTALRHAFANDVNAHGEATALVDEEMSEKATDAELKLRGDGIRYLLDAIGKKGLAIKVNSKAERVGASEEERTCLLR